MTKGAATRAAIKAAAGRVFAHDGFANAKVATIMAAADRSPGAFYRHFESKEALLHELLEDVRVELKKRVSVPLRDGEDLLTNLLERTSAFWDVYCENWATVTAAFQLSMENESFAQAWRAVRRQGIRGLGAVITQAQRQGYCKSMDPELTASALCSMLEYTCYNWTSEQGDFPNRSIPDEAAAGVLRRIVVQAVLWKDPAETAAHPTAEVPRKQGRIPQARSPGGR